jgi:CrcB protein
MFKFILIGFGGFIGTILRYSVTVLCQHYSLTAKFPINTLIVNALGTGLIGFYFEKATHQAQSTPLLSLFIMTGILGGFTTFSAFGLDTYLLFKNSNILLAILNVLANLIISMIFLFLGLTLGRV